MFFALRDDTFGLPTAISFAKVLRRAATLYFSTDPNHLANDLRTLPSDDTTFESSTKGKQTTQNQRSPLLWLCLDEFVYIQSVPHQVWHSAP
jgi:hypothetical protein